MNSDLDIALRRYRNSLRICGLGVIAFGLWSLVRLYLSFIFGEMTFGDIVRSSIEKAEGSDPQMMGTLTWIVVLAISIIAGAIILCLHLIVGLGALRASGEDSKKKPKGFYLVLDGIFALISVISIIAVIMYLFSDSFSGHVSLVTLFVELTSLYIYIDLIRSAVKVRQISMQLKAAKGA